MMLAAYYHNADGLTGLSVKLCSYLDILLRGFELQHVVMETTDKKAINWKAKWAEKKKGKGEVKKNESI